MIENRCYIIPRWSCYRVLLIIPWCKKQCFFCLLGGKMPLFIKKNPGSFQIEISISFFGKQKTPFCQSPSRLKFWFKFFGQTTAFCQISLGFLADAPVRKHVEWKPMPNQGKQMKIPENKIPEGGLGWFEEESRSGLGLEMWPIVNKPSLPWTNRILTLTILRKVFGVRCVKNFMIQIVFDFAIFNDGAIIMMH